MVTKVTIVPLALSRRLTPLLFSLHRINIFQENREMLGIYKGRTTFAASLPKLGELKIQRNESKKRHFGYMESEEQEAFLEDWIVWQAYQMSEKLDIEPALSGYIQEVNGKIEESLVEEGYIQPRMRSTAGTDFKIKDSKRFFANVRERLTDVSWSTEPESALRGLIYSGVSRIPATKVRSVLASKSRKGDFLVALPVHGQDYALINFDNTWQVGHAGIITSTITNYTDTIATKKITLEAWIGQGVTDEKTISTWTLPCYVMGIQKVTYEWKWRGFKSGLYPVRTPVSNPSALATKAALYKNKRYVHWYEFLTAKWAAPAAFTCTTLVWYCSKEAYDINISDWWTTLVTPSGLYTDESTYVRGEINN
jgi:hypothetical protein